MARNIEDYERALIGSVLLTPGRMADAVTAGTSPEWFTSDAWGLMWSALANFWRRGEIDGITPLNVKAEAERIASNPKDRRDAHLMRFLVFRHDLREYRARRNFFLLEYAAENLV